MKWSPLRKSLLAYALVALLASLMLWQRVGGILPVLMWMGLVLGGAHLVAVLPWEEDDEPPADSSL